MKISYLSLLPPPGQPAGSGVLKVSETLLREYERMEGIEVEAVTLIDGLAAPVVERKGSVRYRYLPCKASGKTATLYLREVRQLKREIHRFQPDIVHGQPTAEYLLAATGWGGPNVITIHGLVLREAKGLGLFHPGTWANLIREGLQRRAARRTSDVISISPYVDAYLAGWCPATIHPVPNPIDPEFFEIAPPEGGAGLRIICVGIVSNRKNQMLLVRACRLLKERKVPFECRIIGKTQPDALEAIRQEIAAAGLAEQVQVCGLVSREELRGSYEWATAVVLPSREETAPLSLIQALAAGRPAFGAASAGIPALLEDGRRGDLFDGDEPAALATLLERRSREMPGLLERAAGIRSWALGRFHPEAVARATVALYQEIVTGSRSGALRGLPRSGETTAASRS
jgi:glycosyltransferase involved in cell wall biosynthesis